MFGYIVRRLASAGLVVAPLVGGMAIAAPLWSSRMDRHGQARVILVSLGCLVLAASALLVLVLPRILPGWPRTAPRSLPIARFFDRGLSRAPSLQVLCISRT